MRKRNHVAFARKISTPAHFTPQRLLKHRIKPHRETFSQTKLGWIAVNYNLAVNSTSIHLLPKAALLDWRTVESTCPFQLTLNLVSYIRKSDSSSRTIKILPPAPWYWLLPNVTWKCDKDKEWLVSIVSGACSEWHLPGKKGQRC
jgi:hypothetical protein